MEALIVAVLSWPWGTGVGTNLAASAICAVIVWLWALRKLHCSVPKCFRPGRHPVSGTTFHTCQKHTTRFLHDQLRARHAEKLPEQHEHLNGGES